jgi:site-specific DNA recombinase
MGMPAAPVLVGAQRPVPGTLAQWAEGLSRSRAGRRGGGVLRFAFDGRVSTEDWQDPVTSRARQLQQALMLVTGVGMIVAEFFDIRKSRTLP